MLTWRMFQPLLVVAAAALAVLVGPTPTASAAAKLFGQGPCGFGDGPCLSSTGGLPVSFRSFTFNAPSKGKAEVTFHGTLYCANGGGGNTVDFTTQINAGSETTPSAAGPGGLRQAEVIINGQSKTFNLASTRGITLTKAGNVTVVMRVKINRFDASISCFLYNAAIQRGIHPVAPPCAAS